MKNNKNGVVSQVRHGYGVLFFASGQRYEGMFREDFMEGRGITWYAKGEVY